MLKKEKNKEIIKSNFKLPVQVSLLFLISVYTRRFALYDIQDKIYIQIQPPYAAWRIKFEITSVLVPKKCMTKKTTEK